jgi:isocitrate/isopropylmalate dehydrogenase
VALYEPGARASHDLQTGKNVANPTAMLMASANMLRHLGFVLCLPSLPCFHFPTIIIFGAVSSTTRRASTLRSIACMLPRRFVCVLQTLVGEKLLFIYLLQVRTADLGGNSSTTAFTAAVVKALVDPAILASSTA